MYCTSDDLLILLPESVLAELSNDQPPYTVPDDDNVERAIYQADREIDAWLVTLMSVPLDPVPQVIAVVSAKMAVYFLHMRKHITSEAWEREYERCVKLLQDIHDGKRGLGPAAGEEPKTETGIRIAVSSRAQKFTPAVWQCF